MLLTVGIILTGVPLGYALRNNLHIVQFTDHCLTWIVRFLLFVMGVAIGANKDLMSQWDTLGLQAFFIALASVVGSLLVARCIRGFLPQIGTSFSDSLVDSKE